MKPVIDTLFTDPITGTTITETAEYKNISDKNDDGVGINI